MPMSAPGRVRQYHAMAVTTRMSTGGCNPAKADISQCYRHARLVPIMLQKSKIERPQKSRER
jgi:hypothetical protein